MINTGAIRMAINEEIKEKLGLKNGILMNVALADGSIKQVEMVGGIKVRFGDRTVIQMLLYCQMEPGLYFALSL